MKKLHIINTFTKEEELALSLFRIPLNFFSEDKPKIKKNSENINVNSSSNTSPDISVNLDANDLINGKHISLDTSIDTTSTTSSKSSTLSSTTEHQSENEEQTIEPQGSQEINSLENKSTEEQKNTYTSNNVTKNNTQNDGSMPKETTAEVTADSNSSANSKKDSTPPPPPAVPEKSPSSDEPKEDNAPKEPKENVPDNTPNKEPEPDTDEPSTPKSEPDNKRKKDPNKKDDDKDKPKDKADKNSPNEKEPDGLVKRFKEHPNKGTGKPPKNQKDMPGKDTLKNAGKDAAKKVGDNTNIGQANEVRNMINKGQKYIDAAKNAADDPSQAMDAAADAVGNLAVKAVALSGDAIAPGLGQAIDKVDKVVGSTEIGQKSKKAIGYVLCGSIVFIILAILFIIFIVVFTTISAFSWATNWAGNKEDYEGTDYEEYLAILEASHDAEDYSLKDLINEIELGRKQLWVIQNTLEDALENHYLYKDEKVDEYNSKHQDLIKEGKIAKLNYGGLTSFGTVFELLADNYSVFNLKAPSSAPQRLKDDKKYTTYDPEGIHQALFEDVLNNMDYLIARFDGQVHKEWFDNLKSILDQKFDVYVSKTNETYSLSLRDLFKETSTQRNDTEYDVYTVKSILADAKHNSKIIEQYQKMVKELSSLEIMTYMLSYQKFYNQISALKEDYSYCTNVDMYNNEFFTQFVTFTDIEQYIALSRLSDHSLVYEIAASSIDISQDAITVETQNVGGATFLKLIRFTNWYATYNFDPKIETTGDGYTFTMPCESMDITSIQQKLFDKYNVEANSRFGVGENNEIEATPEENASNFFSLFEISTGISMSIGTNGNNIPVYELNSQGVVTGSHFEPIQTDGNTQAKITMSYGQSYSDATLAKFGINHKTHTGVDYAVATGTPVYATSSGTAYIIRGNTGYGNYVKLVQDDGYTSIYAHGNGTFYVENGARVTAGQPIMQSGNSGNSTGPHLHFEIRNQNGTTINPTYYIYGQA